MVHRMLDTRLSVYPSGWTGKGGSPPCNKVRYRGKCRAQSSGGLRQRVYRLFIILLFFSDRPQASSQSLIMIITQVN